MTFPAPLLFQLHPAGGPSAALPFHPTRLVIAGWAGRDVAALRHHIAKLAALGVAPPSTTPLFYAASPSLLTQAPVVAMLGADSSGEVEPLLLAAPDDSFVGLGSDHTDRAAEAWSVPHSKQLCAKPVASTVWRFADVAGHWDALVLRSWIPAGDRGWTLYQEGAVASLRHPDALATLAGGLAPGSAMLCGTLAAIGGVRPAPAFRMELQDPILGRSITHEYRVTCLPIVT